MRRHGVLPSSVHYGHPTPVEESTTGEVQEDAPAERGDGVRVRGTHVSPRRKDHTPRDSRDGQERTRMSRVQTEGEVRLKTLSSGRGGGSGERSSTGLGPPSGVGTRA